MAKEFTLDEQELEKLSTAALRKKIKELLPPPLTSFRYERDLYRLLYQALLRIEKLEARSTRPRVLPEYPRR